MYDGLDFSLFKDRKINAVLSILLTLYLTVSSVNIFFQGDVLWSLYAIAIIVLVFIPTAVLRDIEAMPPFEILLLLAVPFTIKGLEIGFVASRTLGYLSAAAVALLILTELDTHTSFNASPKFSLYLVVIFTIALSGFWALARWIANIQLGTAFEVTNAEIMWEFASAALAGIVSGALFGSYFRERDKELVRDEA